MLVVFVHSFLFFILLLLFFIHFQAILPCHWRSTLASQAREDLQQLCALPRLLLIAFSFSFTASATILSRHFLPTGIFYLMLLHRRLLALMKASLEAGSSSLKFAGLHADPRNTEPDHSFV